MSTQVTFTTEFTPGGLAELHNRIGALIAVLPIAGPAAEVDHETPHPSGLAPESLGDTDRVAKELRDSIGSNNRALVKQMTSYGDDEFTMPDVAGDMGVAEATVQARFRNLSKVLNRLRAKYPTVATWEAEQHGGRWHFRARPAWRQAIERTWK
jgi:hypothetical protein